MEGAPQQGWEALAQIRLVERRGKAGGTPLRVSVYNRHTRKHRLVCLIRGLSQGPVLRVVVYLFVCVYVCVYRQSGFRESMRC